MLQFRYHLEGLQFFFSREKSVSGTLATRISEKFLKGDIAITETPRFRSPPSLGPMFIAMECQGSPDGQNGPKRGTSAPLRGTSPAAPFGV